MQYAFSCTPTTYGAIEATLSQPRLTRYLTAANHDRHLALRYYVWNARLCEEFYIPTQIAEVAFRNALAKGLQNRFGANWHTATTLSSTLPQRLQRELRKAITDESLKHGANFTADHIVSAISLGFWVHLTTKSPRNYIWQGSLSAQFPNLPIGTPEEAIHDAADGLRKFRNRIAHHNAIFDKRPTAEYRNIQDILSWICPETLWLVRQLSNPARIVSQRPK